VRGGLRRFGPCSHQSASAGINTLQHTATHCNTLVLAHNNLGAAVINSRSQVATHCPCSDRYSISNIVYCSCRCTWQYITVARCSRYSISYTVRCSWRVLQLQFVSQLWCIAGARCACYSISCTVCCSCSVLQLQLQCVTVAVCCSCSVLQMLAVLATQFPIQFVAVAVVCCSCSVLQMLAVIATQSPLPNDYRAYF